MSMEDQEGQGLNALMMAIDATTSGETVPDVDMTDRSPKRRRSPSQEFGAADEPALELPRRDSAVPSFLQLQQCVDDTVLQLRPLTVQLEQVSQQPQSSCWEPDDYKRMTNSEPLDNIFMVHALKQAHQALPAERALEVGIVRCDVLAFRSDMLGCAQRVVQAFPKKALLREEQLHNFEIVLADFRAGGDHEDDIGHFNLFHVLSLAQCVDRVQICSIYCFPCTRTVTTLLAWFLIDSCVHECAA